MSRDAICDALFVVIDVDESGALSVDEFTVICKKVNEDITFEECESMFESCGATAADGTSRLVMDRHCFRGWVDLMFGDLTDEDEFRAEITQLQADLTAVAPDEGGGQGKSAAALGAAASKIQALHRGNRQRFLRAEGQEMGVHLHSMLRAANASVAPRAQAFKRHVAGIEIQSVLRSILAQGYAMERMVPAATSVLPSLCAGPHSTHPALTPCPGRARIGGGRNVHSAPVSTQKSLARPAWEAKGSPPRARRQEARRGYG